MFSVENPVTMEPVCHLSASYGTVQPGEALSLRDRVAAGDIAHRGKVTNLRREGVFHCWFLYATICRTLVRGSWSGVAAATGWKALK